MALRMARQEPLKVVGIPVMLFFILCALVRHYSLPLPICIMATLHMHPMQGLWILLSDNASYSSNAHRQAYSYCAGLTSAISLKLRLALVLSVSVGCTYENNPYQAISAFPQLMAQQVAQQVCVRLHALARTRSQGLYRRVCSLRM